MTRMVIWRHGQTEWNAGERVQGHADIGLNEVGRWQAEATAPSIAALHPDVVVSSDLRRAADTAAVLAELIGLEARFDSRLRERGYGQWQGCLLSEIAERWPEEYARWRAGEPVPRRGVESTEKLARRASEAFREIAARAPGGTVVVVTHGGTARHGCGALLGWPPPAVRTLGSLANCHWTELHWDAAHDWQLRAHNVGLSKVWPLPVAAGKPTEPAGTR